MKKDVTINSMTDKGLRPIKPWQSIRGRLFLFSAAILALSLFAVSVFILNIYRSNILNNKRVENINVAEQVSSIVELYMDAIVRDLFSVSSILSYEAETISNRRTDLEKVLGRMEDVRLFSVSDIYGNELLEVLREESLTKTLLDDKAKGEKIDSVLEGNIYIGHVYPAAQAVPLVDISVPIMGADQTQVGGILTAVINLNSIYKRLDEIKLESAQEIYLVDTNGWLIAYLSQMLGKKTSSPPFWGDLGHIIKVQQYMSGISEMNLKEPLIYKNMRQQDVLGVLAICQKLKWGVIVEEQVTKILDPMGPIIKKHIIVTLFIFIIVSILAAIVIGFITSPVVRLYRSTEGLAGEMERISIQGKDEIGRIAQNINQLIKELCQKDEHLRRRYKELEAVNQEFEHSYEQLEQVSEDLEASQESLLREKDFTNKLIEAANFLIVGLDLEGKIVIFNRRCEEKLLYGHDEVMGRDWFEVAYAPQMRSAAIRRFRAMLEGEAQGVVEDQILTKDGHSLNIAWHTTIMNNSKGLPECVVLIGEDISQKQRMEEELRSKNAQLVKNNEELENILSIVSHDLKNPLYILQDFASILLQDYQGSLNEDGLYYLERIKVNAQHMEKLIMDLLELSRTSRVKGAWQECSISDIVNRAVEEFRGTIKTKQIQIKISESFPICLCDPERILQVFMNLLSNSIKFINNVHNPSIEIGYRDTKDEYEFYVKDNGIGIDKEYHEKVFVIFQRLQDIKGVEGTGVGLTIVKKVVGDHGGRVWVESKKGEGATFYFTIPKAIPKPEQKQKLNMT